MSAYATTTVRWRKTQDVASSSATVGRNTILIVAMTPWLADFIYTGGAFESGLAMIVDEAGLIARFSRDEVDLKKAQRLPGRAILPGLVNVHSHTFQRGIRGRPEHRTSPAPSPFLT